MEPVIGVNFAHFLPYGSGPFNSGNRLLGAFGSATLEGVSDYYSQLIYKVCFFAKVSLRFLLDAMSELVELVLVFHRVYIASSKCHLNFCSTKKLNIFTGGSVSNMNIQKFS